MAGYVTDMRLFAAWFNQANGEPLTAQGCTPVDVQTFRREMLAQGLGAATVNRRLSAIRAWGRFLQETGQRDDPLAGGVQAIRRGREPAAPKGLDKNEVHSLLRTAQRSRHPVRDYALVQMMLQTGLRVGELAALHVNDCTVNGRSGSVLVRCGKGRQQRRVQLNETARKALRAWLELRALMDVRDSELWISQKGGPLAKVSIQQAIQGLMEAAGLAGFSSHSLRHTFAMFYLDDHRDLRGLADILGHTSMNTTAIYTKPSERTIAARMEAMSLNAY